MAAIQIPGVGSTKTVIVLAEIVGILLLITVLVILIRRWIKKNRERKEEEKGLEVGKQITGSETVTDAAKKIGGMTKSELEKYKTDYRNFDYVGTGKLIWDAKGTFYDDPEAVYGALARIPSKAVLSSFQTYFKDYYKRELLTFLQSFLSLAEQGKVAAIIEKLPKV